jgi:hypothetical protein
MNKFQSLALFLFLTCFSGRLCAAADSQGVTYTFYGNKGRFGDHLMAYMRAKWISYQYDIPLYYRPFALGDDLVLSQEDAHLTREVSKRVDRKITWNGEKNSKGKGRFTLYVAPYFPESQFEREVGDWPYFEVDWNDAGFRRELKRVVAPLEPLPKLEIPEGYVGVAAHVRKGGGFDPGIVIDAMPLKFPPEGFYLQQIRALSKRFEGKPLYVYLFTDDPNPRAIVERLTTELGDVDVTFGYRQEGNTHYSHVLEDFFAMMQFSCLIRPDSNFSIAASKVGDYQVVISPETFERVDGKVVINRVHVEVKH